MAGSDGRRSRSEHGRFLSDHVRDTGLDRTGIKRTVPPQDSRSSSPCISLFLGSLPMATFFVSSGAEVPVPIQTHDDTTVVPAAPVNTSMLDLSPGSLATSRQLSDFVVGFTASGWGHRHTYDGGPFSDDDALNDDIAWTYASSSLDSLMPFLEQSLPPLLPDLSLDEFLDLCDDAFPDGSGPSDPQAPRASSEAAYEPLVTNLTRDPFMWESHAPNEKSDGVQSKASSNFEAEDGMSSQIDSVTISTASPSTTHHIAVIDLTGLSEGSIRDGASSEEYKDSQTKGVVYQEAKNTFIVVAGCRYPVYSQGEVYFIDLTTGAA